MCISALIAAGASIAGAAISGSAASNAADAQADAANEAAQVQRDTVAQSRIDAYPWMLTGASALNQLGSELGLSMPVNPLLPDLNAGPIGGDSGSGQPQTTREWVPGTSQTPVPQITGPGEADYNFTGNNSDAGYWRNVPGQEIIPPNSSVPQMTKALGFRETPGYRFAIEQGERGVLNNLSALGMRRSGHALKQLARFRTGLANQDYGNYMNRLSGLAGTGQTAVTNQNSLAANGAINIGNQLNNAGAARASGYVGRANAINSGLSGIGNALGRVSYGGGGMGNFANNSSLISSRGGLY